MYGGLAQARFRAPKTAVGFASWGLTFSLCECSLVALRKKEDPWNSIMSGATTGFVLALRQGRGAAITSGIVGGVFLAMIEGAGVLMNKMSAEGLKPQPLDLQQPATMQ